MDLRLPIWTIRLGMKGRGGENFMRLRKEKIDRGREIEGREKERGVRLEFSKRKNERWERDKGK